MVRNKKQETTKRQLKMVKEMHKVFPLILVQRSNQLTVLGLPGGGMAFLDISCLKSGDVPRGALDGSCWLWLARDEQPTKTRLSPYADVLMSDLAAKAFDFQKSYEPLSWLYEISRNVCTRFFQYASSPFLLEEGDGIQVCKSIVDYYGKYVDELREYGYNMHMIDNKKYLCLYEYMENQWKIKQILPEMT